MFALTFTQLRRRCQIHFSMICRCPKPTSLLHLLLRPLATISISWINSCSNNSKRHFMCSSSSSNSNCNYSSSSNTGSNCRNSKRYCHLPCQQLSFHQVNHCRSSTKNEYENKNHYPQAFVPACFVSVQSLLHLWLVVLQQTPYFLSRHPRSSELCPVPQMLIHTNQNTLCPLLSARVL